MVAVVINEFHLSFPHVSWDREKPRSPIETETKVVSKSTRSSRPGAAEMNPTRNHEVAGSVPGLAQ